MKTLSDLTVDELADGICLRAGRIAAAHAELLSWIAEFDRREGWGGPGMLSCAQWLSWRIGLSPGAAREQVRVARRLEDLPAVAVAFADGRLSYSKVRAITRVAEPGDTLDWVYLGRHSSAAQLELIVRGAARARAGEQAQADPELADWKVRTRTRYDRDGNFVMTITARPEYAPVVQAGLEARRAELQRELDARPVDAPPVDPPASVAPAPATPDVPAGTPPPPLPALAAATLAAPSAATPSIEAADLDAPPDGWPVGTTLGQVRAAASALTEQWAEESVVEEQTQSDPPTTLSEVVAPAKSMSSGGAADVPAGTSRTCGAPDVPAGTPGRPRATDGDALLALAQEALAAEKAAHPDLSRRRRPQLTAQVDPLSGWARMIDGELLPPASLRAVMKSLPGRGGPLRLRPVTDLDLRRFDLGRSSRVVSPALRELLGTVDGERCRFPGCTRHSKLHAHHVEFWSAGGPTDLRNLVLVCSRHHTLIHTQGFSLVLHPDRRLTVASADGIPLLHHPAQPWGDPTALAPVHGEDVPAGTLAPETYTPRLDLGYVVSVVMAQAA